MSWRRCRGVFRRHWYLWSRNVEYFLESLWQPVVDVLIWGFVTLYLQGLMGALPDVMLMFLAGALLWSAVRRGQHEVTFTFMEEAWSRNLMSLCATPLREGEWMLASILFGLAKLMLQLLLMGVLIWMLYALNVLSIGWSLLPFVLSLLMFGWALGLVINAGIIRFGRGLVPLSWVMAFMVQPFACVFYPVTALPGWAQAIAKALPCTYIFEGMRIMIAEGRFMWGYWLTSIMLDLVYLGVAVLIVRRTLRLARKNAWLPRLEW